MNLDDIAAGTTVFLDANIFIYAEQQKSAQSVRLLRRFALGEVTGMVSTITVAEVCHRLMIVEAQARKLVSGGNPARSLAEKPQRVRQLSDYATKMLALCNSGLEIKPVLATDLILGVTLQQRWGLLTNDSLNLAVCQRLGVHDMATADTNFDGVGGLRVFHPTDLIG
ncbi:MAG: type II toxin-antitoxin system VapC family toxin [Verrucomicrobia bacterium]|nr:type II toxin-antitoxin system VapC family toxin [Verrucomicrobiota bacterium]